MLSMTQHQSYDLRKALEAREMSFECSVCLSVIFVLLRHGSQRARTKQVWIAGFNAPCHLERSQLYLDGAQTDSI